MIFLSNVSYFFSASYFAIPNLQECSWLGVWATNIRFHYFFPLGKCHSCSSIYWFIPASHKISCKLYNLVIPSRRPRQQNTNFLPIFCSEQIFSISRSLRHFCGLMYRFIPACHENILKIKNILSSSKRFLRRQHSSGILFLNSVLSLCPAQTMAFLQFHVLNNSCVL